MCLSSVSGTQHGILQYGSTCAIQCLTPKLPCAASYENATGLLRCFAAFAILRTKFANRSTRLHSCPFFAHLGTVRKWPCKKAHASQACMAFCSAHFPCRFHKKIFPLIACQDACIHKNWLANPFGSASHPVIYLFLH